MNDRDLASDARELLEKIASAPRFAGSDSEANVRQLCASLLKSHGFSVREDPFTFSEFPARYGPTVLGLLLIAAVLLASHMYTDHGGAGPAIGTLLLGLLLTGVAGRWLGGGAVLTLPLLRSSSANLIATRGTPTVWLVAHADSKSQTIPMLVRVAAVVLTFVAVAVLGFTLIFGWVSGMANGEAIIGCEVVPILAIVASAGAIPLVFCLTGNKSPGAVDNASGLVSVLLAVRELAAHADVGVIVTSAEELALAGARAHVESNHARATVVNCDTIDDHGGFLCMIHSRNRGPAAAAVVRAGERLAMPVRVRALIPGILTDSVAFADAGWDAVTVSRGNLGTLARVHTSSDTRERMDGSGIANVARLLAATIEELR
ncbi:MAG: M28 family metallopeptidase [Gemmatimonadota bacterium]|nr:M28 family metallopeptidase [Gemmatimonadota bacterium]